VGYEYSFSLRHEGIPTEVGRGALIRGGRPGRRAGAAGERGAALGGRSLSLTAKVPAAGLQKPGTQCPLDRGSGPGLGRGAVGVDSLSRPVSLEGSIAPVRFVYLFEFAT